MTHSHIHLCESLRFTCQPLFIQEALLVAEVLFSSCFTAYLPVSRKWHTAHLDEAAPVQLDCKHLLTIKKKGWEYFEYHEYFRSLTHTHAF